ncbi:MAG: DUF2752 domain-containing protein [Planctomycetota bacterium]
MNGRWLAISAAAATLVVPGLLLAFAPQVEFSQSVCPHKLLTGFPCPGCGITRSIMSLYRGDLAGSLGYHVFGLPLVITCVIGIAVLAVEMRTNRDLLGRFLFDRRLGIGAGGFLAGYHGVRLVHFVATHSVASILRESVWR